VQTILFSTYIPLELQKIIAQLMKASILLMYWCVWHKAQIQRVTWQMTFTRLCPLGTMAFTLNKCSFRVTPSVFILFLFYGFPKNAGMLCVCMLVESICWYTWHTWLNYHLRHSKLKHWLWYENTISWSFRSDY
jgi:hypothetical protein